MIQARLLKYAIELIGIVAVAVLLYGYGNHNGRSYVQAKWDSDKAATLIITSKAMAERVAENEAIRTKSVNDNKKLKEDYENKIADLSKRRHDGLFIRKTAACSSTALPAPATATGGANDPATSVRLPGPVEQNLRTLADDANVCAIRLKALQAWVAGADTAP